MYQQKKLQFVSGSKSIHNTNELLGNYPGVYGVKTGFTFGAGRCLVTACKKENLDVIVVVLGSTTKKMRTTDSVKVLNYIFNTYSNINIESTIINSFENFEKHFSNNTILKKTIDIPSLKLDDLGNTTFPLSKNEFAKLKIETYALNNLEAPIEPNTKIGFLTIKIDDEILKKVDISTKNKIKKKDFKIFYQDLLKNFFNFF